MSVILLHINKVANCCSYGMVLAKDKNEEEAMRWLIRSVHLYSFNWGCWLEMTSLISRVEDVNTSLPVFARLLTIKAQSNISAPPAEYSLLYIPSSHLTRTLPINTVTFQFFKSAPFNIPNESFPPHMSCSPSLPHQRFRHGRCSLQQSPRSSST